MVTKYISYRIHLAKFLYDISTDKAAWWKMFFSL